MLRSILQWEQVGKGVKCSLFIALMEVVGCEAIRLNCFSQMKRFVKTRVECCM